jgi:hypothetical protein
MADKDKATVPTNDQDRIDYDGYTPASYMDRHVIRHLRHMRDKEYTRLAWRNCKDYSEVYQRCTESTSCSSTLPAESSSARAAPLTTLTFCILFSSQSTRFSPLSCAATSSPSSRSASTASTFHRLCRLPIPLLSRRVCRARHSRYLVTPWRGVCSLNALLAAVFHFLPTSPLSPALQDGAPARVRCRD